MSELEISAQSAPTSIRSSIAKAFSLPFPIFMIVLTVALGLIGGLGNSEIVSVLITGYGNNLGYFCIVLLSAFYLAAWLSHGQDLYLGKAGVVMSPLMGAGMVCPDTAYAALSPLAGRYRTAIAVGSYSGFKLLIPAGPLIIGLGVGANVEDHRLIVLGLILMVTTFVAGMIWLRLVADHSDAVEASASEGKDFQWASSSRLLFPLALLFALLFIGYFGKLSAVPVIGFFTAPAGALLISAIVAYLLTKQENRKPMLDSTIRRTANLLFIIGCASALGHMLARVVPASYAVEIVTGVKSASLMLIGLFSVAAIFKIINGSSLATFSALPPILAPVLANTGIDLIPVVYAICLGSFVAILPNDSFYWLVRNDAFANGSTINYVKTITGASIFQALVGLGALCVITALSF